MKKWTPEDIIIALCAVGFFSMMIAMIIFAPDSAW